MQKNGVRGAVRGATRSGGAVGDVDVMGPGTLCRPFVGTFLHDLDVSVSGQGGWQTHREGAAVLPPSGRSVAADARLRPLKHF